MEDLTSLHIDIGVLKNQVNILTQLCDKYDKVFEKLLDTHEKSTTEIYKGMDRRKSQTDAEIKEINSQINRRIDDILIKVQDTERRMIDEMRSVREEITEGLKQEREKMDKIVQWKWTVVGGIIALTWLLSHTNLDILSRLVK